MEISQRSVIVGLFMAVYLSALLYLLFTLEWGVIVSNLRNMWKKSKYSKAQQGRLSVMTKGTQQYKQTVEYFDAVNAGDRYGRVLDFRTKQVLHDGWHNGVRIIEPKKRVPGWVNAED